MNKNKFSFQFLSSDRLHQINFSLSNFLIFLGMFTAAFVALNYSLSLRFSDDYYKVKLKETDEKYSEVSQELLDKIAKLENELKLIEEKDSELRTYATLAPLSDDVKAQGVGGSSEKVFSIDEVDNSTIMMLKDRVDSLAFAVNIQNDPYLSRGGLFAKGLKTRTDLVAYLNGIDIKSTYLKSASYLMHRPTFSIIRNLILNKSQHLLQDDSGIPIKYFDSNIWDLTYYGNYSYPIPLFKERHQEDLKEVYLNKDKTKPLPFGIGYQFRRGTSNLMRASKK